MKLNTLYLRLISSHTVREICEMRDENIVWNELFVYDDIAIFIDCCCCLRTPLTLASGGGGFRSFHLWSTSQLLRPSDQQYRHFGGYVHKSRGLQRGVYVAEFE